VTVNLAVSKFLKKIQKWNTYKYFAYKIHIFKSISCKIL
jgi:hypothetical protein